MSRRNPKQMTSFRLSDQAKDQLQECVDIERQRCKHERRFWMEGLVTRTRMLELAIASYYTALVNAKKGWEEEAAKSLATPKKKGRKK